MAKNNGYHLRLAIRPRLILVRLLSANHPKGLGHCTNCKFI